MSAAAAPCDAAAPALPRAPADTTLRPARDTDRDTVRLWRNRPAVREVMFTRHEIGATEHAAWWQRVQASPDHHVLVLAHGGRDCGVVTFTRESSAPASDDAGGQAGAATWTWGFYLDPDAFAHPLEQLRAWGGMEAASLHWARDHLQARQVLCEVFAFNAAVLTLHRRHGFAERGRYWRERDGESLEVVQLGRRLA